VILPDALRLIADVGIVAAHLMRRSPDRALDQVSDPAEGLLYLIGWAFGYAPHSQNTGSTIHRDEGLSRPL
jgi:hypothetical protein